VYKTTVASPVAASTAVTASAAVTPSTTVAIRRRHSCPKEGRQGESRQSCEAEACHARSLRAMWKDTETRKRLEYALPCRGWSRRASEDVLPQDGLF